MTVDEAIEQLKRPGAVERAAAVAALGEIESDYARGIAALLSALRDPRGDIRLAAVRALSRIWRSLDPALEWQPGEVTRDQLFELVPQALQNLLTDSDRYVRFEAAESLAQLHATNELVLGTLIEAAGDENELLRRRAAYTFWQGAQDLELAAAPFLGAGRIPLFGVDSERVITALIELLRDQSRSVREYAVNALGSLGPKATAAGSALVAALKDPDEVVRSKAAAALARVDPTAKAPLEMLVLALRDNDKLKRKAAAFALRAMGSHARPALSDLIAALQDEEPRVRARCAAAIGNIGPDVGDEAVHTLLALEADRENFVREAAATALASLGADVVEATRRRAAGFKARDSYPLFGFKPEDVPGFIFMLRDPNPDIRAYACTALRKAGGDINPAIPHLRALLTDEDDDVRRRAAETLKSLSEG